VILPDGIPAENLLLGDSLPSRLRLGNLPDEEIKKGWRRPAKRETLLLERIT
jgi:hypothetical protein